MAHFERMPGKTMCDCLCRDGWNADYCERRSSGSPPARATLSKPGHQPISLMLQLELSKKRVRAICDSAGISADKLAVLRSAVLVPAAVPGIRHN